MNQSEIEQKRRTNDLVRLCYRYLRDQSKLDGDTFYQLCKLTWYSASASGRKHLETVRKPALESIFIGDYEELSNADVARDIATKTKKSFDSIHPLIEQSTGFTALYMAYRNSCRGWIQENIETLTAIAEIIYGSSKRQKFLDVASTLENLPSISGAGNASNMHLKPASLITPLLYSLSKKKTYPIVNKRENVLNLLKWLNLAGAPLADQVRELHSLIGASGIEDAAMLDSISTDLRRLVRLPNQPRQSKVASEKRTRGKNLPLKDAYDITVVTRANTQKAKRIHNDLTNRIRNYFNDDYLVLEGVHNNCLYDVLVEDYFEKDVSLLLEVKSSNHVPDVRMAIGQLYDYGRHLLGDHYRAIFLPNRPDENLRQLAEYSKVMLMWFVDSTMWFYDNETGRTGKEDEGYWS